MASLVKHFRTGLVAFSIIVVPFGPLLTFFIHDSQGPDLSDLVQERNRRDRSGYFMAVEDGVQLSGQGLFDMGVSRRSCIGPFRY